MLYCAAMNTKNVAAHYGDKNTAIKQLGLYRQKWDYWAANGIPLIWQKHIQAITGGELKADKPRTKAA